MAWLVTDFEDVDFCDGTGWAVVAGIHKAIKERAECVVHPLYTIGDYGEEFEGDIWTYDEPDTGGRLYLVEQLRKFHTDITTLVEGNSLIEWTVESAGDDIWTMADLETDIGLGTWEEQLRDSTDPAPLIWLQECLDRLIYVRRYKSDVFGGPAIGAATREFFYKQGGDPGREFGDPVPDYSHAQDAWAAMLADPEGAPSSDPSTSTVSALVGASAFGILATSVPRLTGGFLRDVTLIGTWTRAEWEVAPQLGSSLTISSVDVTIDGGDPVSVTISAVVGEQDPVFVPADEDAIPLTGTRDDVTFDLDLPSSLPFDGHWFGGGFSEDGVGFFSVRLHRAWVYFDISDELTDQA
jgi:hypothetical protein